MVKRDIYINKIHYKKINNEKCLDFCRFFAQIN